MTVSNSNRLGEHQAPSVKLSNQPAARPHPLTQPALGDQPLSDSTGTRNLIPFCSPLQVPKPDQLPTLYRQRGQSAFAFRTGGNFHPVLYLYKAL